VSNIHKRGYIPERSSDNGNGHHTNTSRPHAHGDGLTHVHPHTPETAEHLDFVVVDGDAVVEDSVRQILVSVGEDPDRDGLVKTPQRVARMFHELLDGYEKDVETVINGAMFNVPYDDGDMVVVADIDYNSMCEHHMLPFVGKAHVAYIPRDKVVGLSKIPRIVDMFAHRLQVQERMTNEIADTIEQAIGAEGVMVVVEGHHMCGELRGVKKHGVNMVTTAKRGAFRDNKDLRDEFYKLIGK
jgi:GTP cyclohydrolase I